MTVYFLFRLENGQLLVKRMLKKSKKEAVTSDDGGSRFLLFCFRYQHAFQRITGRLLGTLDGVRIDVYESGGLRMAGPGL